MTRPRRILEVGPKDGLDTRRLLTLHPDHLTLVDLPGRAQVVVDSGDAVVEYIADNVVWMPYPGQYDLIWCTGVLYHVKEQYRLIERFYNWLTPGGTLVLESATIRRWWLRRKRCVEILYPPDPVVKRRYHLSLNVTHLPSSSAIEAWLEMAGFKGIERSECHARVSWRLARHRAAYLATRP